jgi:predicted RNase H-like nuclease (RuvC/YqgF family)
MRTQARPLLATLLALLLSGTWAQAREIYTWRDAQGVVHYSDVKPDSDKAKVLKGGTQRDLAEPAGAGPAKKEEATDPETAFRKRRTEAAEAQAKADKQRQEAQALKEGCEALRNQLTALKSGERMARYNASGEREVIDDATREGEINRLERNLDSCK